VSNWENRFFGDSQSWTTPSVLFWRRWFQILPTELAFKYFSTLSTISVFPLNSIPLFSLDNKFYFKILGIVSHFRITFLCFNLHGELCNELIFGYFDEIRRIDRGVCMIRYFCQYSCPGVSESNIGVNVEVIDFYRLINFWFWMTLMVCLGTFVEMLTKNFKWMTLRY